VAAIVPERAYGGTPLECFVQAASADVDGDPVRYTFSWTVDGSPFGAAVDDGERSTVPGDQVRPSQAWACTVVARDDADATPSATVSLETGTAIVDLEGPFGVPFIAVAPGTFTMGSDTPPAHGPAHEVTLTHAFWLGVTEVTQAQWRQAFAFDGNLGSATPSANGGCDDCPVESVSGYGFRALANAASRQAGLPECYAEWPDRLVEAYMGDPYACPGYRLPTEAEWEYVTGVGGSEFAGARDASQTCWSMYNASSTSPVATLDPNPLGFYDLCGNVEEMMHDWYADGPYPTGPVVDPFGPVDPNTYLWVVVRGGSWGTNVIGLYARSAISVSSGTNRLGVRLARTIP
jgi:formylglycine-generating enzyme required for sulfatase activity